MPGIPLLVVWVALLCGYIPYSMGFAFLNPVVVIAYGFLSLLIGATVTRPGWVLTASLTTTLLALITVNATSGMMQIVLPSWGVLAASIWLSCSGALLTGGLRNWLLRHGRNEEQIRNWLRLLFAALALIVYFNGLLPYDWKMWLAERTTNEHLIRFAFVCGAIFVGIWRMTR